jgi:hypothetical protein
MKMTVVYSKANGAIFGSTTTAKDDIVVGRFEIPDGETLERVDVSTEEPKVVSKPNTFSQSIALEKMQKKLELNDAKLVALGNAITEFSELLGEEGAKDEI